MTRLSASQKMRDAADLMAGRIDNAKGVKIACERAARARAAARSKTGAVIDASELRLAAATGAMDAAFNAWVEILGPTRAKHRLNAMIGGNR